MPELACLMLTSYTDEQAMFDAVLAGAAGYVIKDVRGNDIVNAVREVGAGGRCSTDGRRVPSWVGCGRAVRPRIPWQS